MLQGLLLLDAASLLVLATFPLLRTDSSAFAESVTATAASVNGPRPVSSRQAVQRPSAASEKISAWHFGQTLDANFTDQRRTERPQMSRNSVPLRSQRNY